MSKRRLSLILIIALLLSLFLPVFTVGASASTGYSGVLEDLTAAGNFKIENFPHLTLEYINQVNQDTDEDNDQALMEVIQIAESSAGELYLYVYQPTDKELDLTATAVLLSTEFTPDGQNINPEIYNLELVSSDSVFDKYVVKDFSVSEEPYRYYNIVTLYRAFSPDIDEVTPGGVIENFELGIGVGQQWCAYYENNSLVYEMNTFDTVDVDIGYTGSATFSSGLTLGNLAGMFTYGNVWFIAFNVEDYIVKKIYDAELRYKIRSKTEYQDGFSWTTEFGEWSEDKPVTLTSEDIGTYEGEGLFAREYVWNKISSSEDFLNQMDDQDVPISDEARTYISENKWVFAFLETEIEYMNPTYKVSSEVSGVTVIRLHFMDIKGDVYNLGAVSDRVSPDDIPDMFGSGVDVSFDEWSEKLIAIVMLILILVLFIVLWPFVKVLFKLIFTGIKFILMLFVSFITFPFKLIRLLFTGKWR